VVRYYLLVVFLVVLRTMILKRSIRNVPTAMHKSKLWCYSFFILYILYFDVRNLIIIFVCIKICNLPHRMEITTGKYDLIYPDKLGIDHTNKMLYWMTDKVIHKSDYEGNSHKIVKKSEFYDPNIPRCIFFTKATEYNFFWEKPRVSNPNRSFAPNLLSISYQKSGEVSITSSMDIKSFLTFLIGN